MMKASQSRLVVRAYQVCLEATSSCSLTEAIEHIEDEQTFNTLFSLRPSQRRKFVRNGYLGMTELAKALAKSGELPQLFVPALFVVDQMFMLAAIDVIRPEQMKGFVTFEDRIKAWIDLYVRNADIYAAKDSKKRPSKVLSMFWRTRGVSSAITTRQPIPLQKLSDTKHSSIIMNQLLSVFDTFTDDMRHSHTSMASKTISVPGGSGMAEYISGTYMEQMRGLIVASHG